MIESERVYDVVALNLKRRQGGQPELTLQEGLQTLPPLPFLERRRRLRNRCYTRGASALSGGQLSGAVNLIAAFFIGPIHTIRKLWSQSGRLYLARLCGRAE